MKTGLANEAAIAFSEVVPSAMWMIRLEMRCLAHSQMTVPQFRILAHLSHGLSTNNALAELHGVSVPSMSRMVDGLVRRGFISRSPSRIDRRSVELSLSAKGSKEFRRLKSAAQTRFATRIAKLSEPDQETLVDGLQVMRKLVRSTEDKT